MASKTSMMHDLHLAFHTICRIITVMACCGALIELMSSVGHGQSAIQTAAGAAFALGIAVIPYIFTRMFEPRTAWPSAEITEEKA